MSAHVRMAFSSWGRRCRSAWDVACILVAFPFLGLVGAAVELKGRVAWAAREAGRASYAVYLIHVPLWVMGAYAASKAHLYPARIAPVSGLAYLAGVVAAALVLDRAFDTPTRRVLAKLIHSRPTGVPPVERLAEAP